MLTTVLAVDIGTPPQRVMVFLDTGSYELWVNPRCNTSASVEICENHGHYYPEKSNTSVFVANGFSVRYGTGEAVGHYFRDVIGIASKFQFGGEKGGHANGDGSVYPAVCSVCSRQRHRVHVHWHFWARVCVVGLDRTSSYTGLVDS